jgi:energy-converting hydrogenase Eha subunit C
MSAWGDVGGLEGLKKTILEIVAGVVLIVGGVSTSIAAGVVDNILRALNRTGFVIPASANYVAPIASSRSFAELILMIMFIVIGVVVMIPALLKVFGNLGT